MKNKIPLALSALLLSVAAARAQGTAFTYQGRLNDGTNPANGSYDLRFQVSDAVASQQGPTITAAATAVSNGLFTVVLDFGAVFNGGLRSLAIAARTNGNGAFSNLWPWQAINPTPYAIYAGNAAQVGGQAPTNFVAKTGDTMSGTLNLPANGLTVGTSQLVASGGNVGIGTATPAAMLDVNGDLRANGIITANAGARLNDTTIWLRAGSDVHHGVGYYGYGRPFAGQSNSLDGPVVFGYTGGALATEHDGTEKVALQWNSSGNVGIGTTAPAYALDVTGTFHATDNSKLGGNLDVGGNTVMDGTLKASGRVTAGGGLVIETRTSDPPSPATGQIWLRTDL